MPELPLKISSSAQVSGKRSSEFTRWIEAKIRPVPGNHDYRTAGAVNFFNYFGAAAHRPRGYYSYNVGTWHIIAINSNCSKVGGCQAGSAQEKWLKNDLARHPAVCTLAFWHHPRYSSGYGGNNTSMTAIFRDLYNARADAVLSGHSQDYERFAPQNNASRLDKANGLRQFVVGTGGSFHTGFGPIKPNSRVRNSNTFGVLRMNLRASSYSWKFVPVAGKTFTDSGSATCHHAARLTARPVGQPRRWSWPAAEVADTGRRDQQV
jgi:acid phosphatase type 7